MTNQQALVGWIGALLLAGAVVAQDEHAGHHAPAPAAQPSKPADQQHHDHESMPQHQMDPGMQQQHDEHMKGHEGHTMPGTTPASAADPHAHHGAATVTDGPWSYKGRKNPEPYKKGRWEMVPTNPRTGMYVAAGSVSDAERCRMLKEADYLAVDRTTKAACGMTAQAAPAAASTKPKAPVAGDPGHHAGMGHDPHEHWAAPPEAIARPNPVPRTRESLAMGKKIFDANCVSCHGPNGNGDGPAGRALNPKPTNLQAMHGQHTDGDFAWKIEHGRGPMPAWKGVLTPEQIWHVVNYVQNLGAAEVAPASHDHSDHKH